MVACADAAPIDVSWNSCNELEVTVKENLVMKQYYGGWTFSNVRLASYHSEVENLSPYV